MLSKVKICNQICSKIGVTRKNPKSENLSKRELLVLASAIEEKALPKTTERK